MPGKANAWRSRALVILRSIAGVLAILAWFGLVMVGGIKRIFTSSGFDLTGWLCLLVGVCIAFWTAHRWVNALPGFFLYAGVMALLAIFSGHAGPDRANEIGTLDAAILLAMFVLSSRLTSNFVGRRLGTLEKVLLVTCVMTFAYGVIMEDLAGIDASRAGLYLMFGILVVDWVIRKARARSLRAQGNSWGRSGTGSRD